MTGEHVRVQEALAAIALWAIDGPELDRATALVEAHVPTCTACRTAAADFRAMAADLALGTPPHEPPRRLTTGIRREAGDARPLGNRFRVPTALTAASIVALVGLGAWTMHLTGRVTRAERQQAGTAELISAVSFPQSKVVPLRSSTGAASAQVAAVMVPGRHRLYVFGAMPKPHPDRVYQLWLGHAGVYSSGGTFVPGAEGFVLLLVEADPSAYDAVLITEEPSSGSERPSAERVAESDL